MMVPRLSPPIWDSRSAKPDAMDDTIAAERLTSMITPTLLASAATILSQATWTFRSLSR